MSDVDTSAEKPYESHQEFLEDKDTLIARYWNTSYEDIDQTRGDVVVAVVMSIVIVIMTGVVFFGILWLAKNPIVK